MTKLVVELLPKSRPFCAALSASTPFSMQTKAMTLDPRRYTIAWIAPLEIEARAAIGMLDREHAGRFPMQRGIDYVFEAGKVC